MNTNENTTLPFLDLIFNYTLGIFILFAIAFLLIRPITKKSEVSTQAEYLITVTWPLNNPDDVDTWLQDPMGNVAFFRNKERGLMHLDRDDLGHANDTIFLPDGTKVIYPHNQELMTIRGFVPGEWVLNIHMYRKNQNEATTVNVKMEKLNPSVKTVILKNIILTDNWDEVTVSRFEMTSSGDIIGFDDTYKKLITVGTQ